jgi:hypothetical protein
MTNIEPDLIYVFLPESLGPIDRGDKYEDPIIDELERLGLGEVSGAGCLMGDVREDGTRLIESCGIDVDTNQVEATRAALRDLLPTLGCPAGTQLHYSASGNRLQDEYSAIGWVLEQDRTMLHPGFGV